MRVGILGCGYVGLELGRQLSPDHDVVGVRRSQDGIAAIERAGFDAVQANLTDKSELAAVPDVDAIVFAASSGGRGADAARDIYVTGQKVAIDHFGSRTDAPDRYVYTSSTGVYGDHGGDWVDEETPLDPQTEKTTVLAEAERVALERPREFGFDGTIARFAGLYGPDRYRLERYIEGPVTEGYLNMVHRDDAAGSVAHLLVDELARGETVLVVDDEPVSKWEFSDWLAEQCGVPEPPKQTKDERLANTTLSETARRRIQTSKRCSNEKLRGLEYEFAYPTFREGYEEIITSYTTQNGE
jgi:nucleoside-diphosphate-sugar epimerase